MEYKSELELQSIVYQEFYSKYPEYRIKSNSKHPKCLLMHNYNNPRSEIQGAKLKAAGLVEGTPDLTLYVPKKGYGALIIELKTGIEKPRPSQVEVMNKLKSVGYKVEWTNNHIDASRIIEDYLTD